ncbi:MAG: hypothetical protein ABS81_15375 [Pseudonocardia sp. SCN 72-86]|nr:MAG: hypothetical protein ABS81_15375 [Pseudonocardia sp. SCN 72-86]
MSSTSAGPSISDAAWPRTGAATAVVPASPGWSAASGRIEALVCDSAHEAAWAERNLHERSLPPWNRARGGLESPLHIVLDTSPRSPRVRAVHQPVPDPTTRVFGPYLGGARARLAVAALERVHPVGDHAVLTAAGRDLAERRRVAAPLPELVATITAVLDREPTAVAHFLAELAARRDAAAADLRFEAAGRLQEELAAAEWIVAPQRVTCPGGGDADPAAWTDGTLVRLQVRDGRLHGWHQEPTQLVGSGANGPASWTSFTSRNAALAADLARLPVL